MIAGGSGCSSPGVGGILRLGGQIPRAVEVASLDAGVFAFALAMSVPSVPCRRASVAARRPPSAGALVVWTHGGGRRTAASPVTGDRHRLAVADGAGLLIQL
jgi:hypothetical protein